MQLQSLSQNVETLDEKMVDLSLEILKASLGYSKTASEQFETCSYWQRSSLVSSPFVESSRSPSGP